MNRCALILLGILTIVTLVLFVMNARANRGIPILAYHEVGPLGGGDSALFIDPVEFRRHMHHLKEQGYTTITLRELYAHYAGGRELPRNPVVLTFDDGYRGVYEHAWPVMREFGFRGVLFVTEYLEDYGYMTYAQVSTLVSNGFEVGNHSRTHTDLRTKSSAELMAEVVHYRQELEKRFGVPVTSFSYPMGYFDQQVVDVVGQGGHLIGVTTVEGFARSEHGLLTMRRIPIFRFDSFERFVQKLSRGR